jgi:hypothetical protein
VKQCVNVRRVRRYSSLEMIPGVLIAMLSDKELRVAGIEPWILRGHCERLQVEALSFGGIAERNAGEQGETSQREGTPFAGDGSAQQSRSRSRFVSLTPRKKARSPRAGRIRV